MLPRSGGTVKFLCRQFVSSIYPVHLWDQMFTPDRLWSFRGKTLARYIKYFDSFVDTSEAHLNFSLGLNPSSTSDFATVPNKSPLPPKPLPVLLNPKADKSHSRVASATVAPIVRTQCNPCDTSCMSCFLKGHVAVDCPTKNCGFCAAHQRRLEHYPKSCFHYDYETGLPKPAGGKAKSTLHGLLLRFRKFLLTLLLYLILWTILLHLRYLLYLFCLTLVLQSI